MTRFRLPAALLPLALLLAVAPPPARASARDSTLVVGLALEPPVLDPTINPADPIRTITNGNIFEGLTWITDDGRVVPRLATSWEHAADGRTWTFHLRAGVRFSDGTAFDCAIVKFALGRAAAPGSLNGQRQFFTPITGISCPDAHTAVLALDRPVGDLAYELAWPDAAMVAPATAPTNATRPIGTGPYVFASWQRGDHVTLVRNDHYWGREPAIRTVVWRFISDPLAATNALLGGALDAYPGFASTDMLARFAHDPDFVVAIGHSPAKLILALNEREKPLDDIRVRRALAEAIDRASMVAGLGLPGSTVIGSHMDPDNPDYLDLSHRYPYDPVAAKALLAQAGVGPDWHPVIAIPPVDYARRGGELVQAYLAQVGIAATLRPMSWAQWLSQVFAHHAFDMTVITHVEPNDLDIYARPNYYFGYHSAAYDALFAQYQRATGPADRHRLSQALQRTLADDEPNVFLLSAPHVVVWRRGLQGLWRNAPIPAFPVGDAAWSK